MGATAREMGALEALRGFKKRLLLLLGRDLGRARRAVGVMGEGVSSGSKSWEFVSM
jgi:hypothetical protein